MRRAWIHRFMGLLWLALCSTAVQPWAHELGHLSERGGSAAPMQLAQPAADWDTATESSSGQSGIPEGQHATSNCLVCLHLLGQHLAPAPTHGGAALALSSPGAPHPPAAAAAHVPPAWLTPAPRAPPPLTA